MKTFKSIIDVEQFRNHPLNDTIRSLVSTIINDYPEYRPEDDGYLVHEAVKKHGNGNICGTPALYRNSGNVAFWPLVA